MSVLSHSVTHETTCIQFFILDVKLKFTHHESKLCVDVLNFKNIMTNTVSDAVTGYVL